MLEMGLIVFILLVLLVAQIGFWQVFGAVLGAVALLFLLPMLLIGAFIVAGVIFAATAVRW